MNFYHTKEFNCVILSHLINVKIDDGLWTEDTLGIANFCKQQILINAKTGDDVKLGTFWHEALHIISDALSLNLSEQQIDGISNGILSIIRDNPNLVKGMIR